MQALTYYIALPFIYLLSLLPFPLLYLFSDLVFFLLYRVAGYRKDVVRQNLRNAFPHKSEQEINTLCKAYYHHLCDMFLETFKTLTISPQTMLQRCSLSPGSKALFDRLNNENKSVILVMGHLGNWEWGGNTFSLSCTQQLYVIYHPLRNKYFDGLMYHMRTRFGTKLIAMKNTFREMLGNRKGANATAFIADQTPQPDNAYWTTFLNQDTPVFKGTEIIASKLGSPIVYVHIKKIKRGYYEMHAEMLLEDPASKPDGYISELHTRRLEKDIIAHPVTWLWSHRRWKHKRPAGM
ncbi:lysophospholipid acyltransferase family protein [Nemorincola caseinilytica]|uniref:Lysophospholipid acyltransferase family protein n=1 Tax=Nemorincola caseinilytica TaxID=2054315 RepID=A0ABP8NA13_9BACT